MVEGRNKKGHRKLWIAIAVIVAAMAVAAVAFGFYAGDYYRADARAEAALQSTADVQVSVLDDGDIAFEPRNPQAGIVFYPGGKVQPEAYAPLMRALADRGFLGVIVPMPFNLAVLDVNGADGVQEHFPRIDRWILMGHSLGGSMAAAYADGHEGPWAGLVLLAAYSTSDLSDSDIAVACLRGSDDQVLNEQAYADNRRNLPENATETIIPGGNHAQFGDYGPQSGDGEAAITPEEQQTVAADAIAEAFLTP